MVVRSSEWTFDKRLKRKDVHRSVAKFCAGLAIYRLREIIDDDLVTVQGNSKNVQIFIFSLIRMWDKLDSNVNVVV